MTRAHVIIVGGVPHLHITRPGAPAETRPMGQAELVRLMEEVVRAVLALKAGTNGRLCRVEAAYDDPPPHYLGALGE